MKPESGQTLVDVFQEFLRWDLDEEAEYAGDADGVTLRMSHMSYEGYRRAMRMLRQYMEQHSQPAEDPDEWVIQDVTIVRPGIDQVVWDEKLHDADCGYFSHTHSGSKSDGKMHGYRTGGIFLSVRCRRRDLPKVEQCEPNTWDPACPDCGAVDCERAKSSSRECSSGFGPGQRKVCSRCGRMNCESLTQPQKTRVRLWKNAYGSVMSNPDCENIEGWREIRIDSEGFYTID